MKTTKNRFGSFNCDYRGVTTVASTRRGARIMMEMIMFGGMGSFDERMSK